MSEEERLIVSMNWSVFRLEGKEIIIDNSLDVDIMVKVFLEKEVIKIQLIRRKKK